MDFWIAVVMIVVVTSAASCFKAWATSPGRGVSAEAQRALRQQETAIAELRARVESLESLVVHDPASLASARVQQAIGASTLPTRIAR